MKISKYKKLKSNKPVSGISFSSVYFLLKPLKTVLQSVKLKELEMRLKDIKTVL